jgi:6-phosphogluconolactonase
MPTVQKFASSEELTTSAAAQLADLIVARQAAKGTASVVLTGGGTGVATLAALRAHADRIDWKKIDLYWGDERFLPPGHRDRNEVQAREALLDHVPVDPARVHAMPADEGEFRDNPHLAAERYRRILPRTFDVHLLGMGGEGHINSLFPHTPAVEEPFVTVVAVTDSPKPPPVRVTLTLLAVNTARQVWLLVAGADKAEAVAAAVAGASPAQWPAAGARGMESTVWFLDNAAATRLQGA